MWRHSRITPTLWLGFKGSARASSSRRSCSPATTRTSTNFTTGSFDAWRPNTIPSWSSPTDPPTDHPVYPGTEMDPSDPDQIADVCPSSWNSSSAMRLICDVKINFSSKLFLKSKKSDFQMSSCPEMSGVFTILMSGIWQIFLSVHKQTNLWIKLDLCWDSFDQLCRSFFLSNPSLFRLRIRNDFYLTIEKGNFERGGKAAARNIEVSIVVIDRDGKPIENCIFAAAGIPGRTRLESSVLYHTNSPIWGETFRLEVPIDKFYHSHIRIEYRHCSSK